MRLPVSIPVCLVMLALGASAGAQGTAAPNTTVPTVSQKARKDGAPAAAAKSTARATKKTTAKTKAAKSKKPPEPQPQVQAPPPPPPTPAQLPPTAARVSMRNGLLTIEANNSTLADVLTGVRRETKAAIDLPPGASGERVVANLGPGTPQNVLSSLFNGSRFDYIILGSQDQPDSVQRVILMAKSGPQPGPANANAAPPNGGGRPQPATQPEEQESNDDNAPAEEAPDDAQQQQQPPQQEIDGEQQQGQQQGEQQQQQQGQQPGVKTPEQLLEELRQMQQQQQQNQQQPQQPQQQQQPEEQ